MTIDKLVSVLKSKVSDERKLGLEILHLLAEVVAMNAHLKMGYSSLHEFCVKELKCSDGQAVRRVKAMQLLRDVPNVEAQIGDGSLNLSVAAQAQNFFQQQKVVDQQKKEEIISQLNHKSARETETILTQLSGGTPTRKIEIDEETFKLIQELQALRSHKEQKIGALIRAVVVQEIEKERVKRFGREEHQRDEQVAVVLKPDSRKAKNLKTANRKDKKRTASDRKLDAREGATGNEAHLKRKTTAREKTEACQNHENSVTASTSKLSRRSRHISAEVRRAVFRRDRNCTFVAAVTGRRCCSEWQLEIDHIWPFALSGSNELGNLRLLCDAHNRARQVDVGGDSFMASSSSDRAST